MTFERISAWASILGIPLSIAAFFSEGHPIQVWIISTIALIFILISVVSCYQNGRNSRYLRAGNLIRDTYNRLAIEKQSILNKDVNGIIKDLSDMCAAFAEAFEIIKKDKIGVCIKYLNKDATGLYVMDLCRDAHSLNERRSRYREDVKDYIDHNTDFKAIFSKIDRSDDFNQLYYFQNNLVEKHQYSNTHLYDKELPSGLFSFFKRRRLWPLLYRSTIVVPILGYDNSTVEVFLCIDSKKLNGFSEKDDVPIVQHISLFIKDLVIASYRKVIE